MPRGSDVIVVGAGIIGCAVAFELASRGATVRVLERRAPALGATQASAGMLAPYLEAHGRDVLLDLTLRSLALYDDTIARVRARSTEPVEYGRQGSLEIAADEASEARLRRFASELPASAGAEWIDSVRLTEFEPWVSPGARGAVLVRAHGYVAAEAFTAALASAARALGVAFERADVVSAEGVPDGVALRRADGGSARASWVVMATGAWAASVGTTGGDAAGVHPVRGQIVRLRTAAAGLQHVLWAPGCYIVPWTDGTVLVGATEEHVGFEERVTADAVRTLIAAATAAVPPLATADFVEARAGLRPATTTGLPLIGPAADTPRLVYATGHFRNGILLAPLTAKMVADVVTSEGF